MGLLYLAHLWVPQGASYNTGTLYSISGISSVLLTLDICACPRDFIMQCFLLKLLEVQMQPSKYQSIFRTKTELCCCCSVCAPKPEVSVRVACWSCPMHPNSLLAGTAGGAELARDSQVPCKTQVSPFAVQLMTAVSPELTYSLYSQCQSFRCWKIQAIINENPLGFRNTAIRWFKKRKNKNLKQKNTKQEHE